MKKLLVLLALLLMLSLAYAYDINACKGDGDWNAVGDCIIRGTFGGDYLFFAIIMLSLFAIFMWQTNMPEGAVLGVGLVVFFALGSFLGVYYQVLLNLTILAIGVMIGLAILHFIRR